MKQSLSTDVAEKRFCATCTRYISQPPYMKSKCCGAIYDSECKTLMERDKSRCSSCEGMIGQFEEDTKLDSEFKKYNWSMFEPTPVVDDSSLQATGKEIVPYHPEQQARMKVESEFGEFYVDSVEEATQLLMALNLSAGNVDSTSQKANMRPSRKLDIPAMTGATERILSLAFPADLEGLGNDYRFINSFMINGIVPAWDKICERAGVQPGVQSEMRNYEEVEVFFNTLGKYLEQLKPGRPFFFTFVCQNSNPSLGVTGEFSRVARVMRHPISNNLVLLMTSEFDPQNRSPFQLGRLAHKAYPNAIQLASFLKFTVLLSEAKMVAFVQPTLKGDSRLKGVIDIDIAGLRRTCPVFDMHPGFPTKNDKKVLLAAAQCFGMKRVRQNDSLAIPHLVEVVGGVSRGMDLTMTDVASHLEKLGYGGENPCLVLSQISTQLRSNLSTPEEIEEAQFIMVQKNLSETLKEVLEVGNREHVKGYVALTVQPFSSSAPEEILILAYDNDSFFIVNMKSTAMSTQRTNSIDGVCAYCKVFIAGCRTKDVQVTHFSPVRGKKSCKSLLQT